MASRYYRDKIPKRGRELTGDDPIIKSLAGGVEGKPHSSKEGRMASALRKFGRISDDAKYDRNPFKPKVKRTKKFAGGPIIKKIITKLKPKPKKVDVDVDKLLKKLGDEIKAAPLPPQLKKLAPKLKKAFPHHSSTGKLKK